MIELCSINWQLKGGGVRGWNPNMPRDQAEKLFEEFHELRSEKHRGTPIFDLLSKSTVVFSCNGKVVKKLKPM